MLVSDSHKFVFHHVPKTGGTSITAALAPYCNLWKGTLPEDEKHGWQVQFHQVGLHLPVKEAIESVLPWPTGPMAKWPWPDDFPKGYFSFAFVRNPFEVIVSAWDFEKYKEFDVYVEHEIFTGLEICARRSQYEYLTDNGKLLVDFVGRYENLSGDFYEIVNEVKVPLMMLPKRNISKGKKSKDYRKYFTPLSRKTVERKFEKDLNFFNYEF